jgi:hypothetical protein
MASGAGSVYSSDITYGSVPGRRGHWTDRLAAMDKDIAALAEKLKTAPAAGAGRQDDAAIEQAVRAATGRPSRPSIACVHTPPAAFHPGGPLALSLVIPNLRALSAVHLHYRHVDQAERWLQAEMEPGPSGFTAAIPADYTQSVYPLQYYFELRDRSGGAWLYPAFNSTRSNQPYYAVSRRIA